jgi:hypothetical protein
MNQAGIESQADHADGQPASGAITGVRKTAIAASEGMIEPIAIPDPVPNGAVRLRHGIIDSFWLRWLALLEERSRPER